MEYPSIFGFLNEKQISYINEIAHENLGYENYLIFLNSVLKPLTDEQIKIIYNQYPKTINKEKWIEFYSHDSYNKELDKLLTCMKIEGYKNISLNKIYSKLEYHKKKNMYIDEFTPDDGNCLFHALVNNGIGCDAQSLRRGISYIMYVFKDSHDFFDNPSLKDTFETTFKLFNEIHIVKSKKLNLAFKFSFELMCFDMFGNSNFNSTLTHLVLLIISQLYKVNIHIFHDNDAIDYYTTISAWEHLDKSDSKDIKNIYLGQIGEIHYISIKEIPDYVIKLKSLLNEKTTLTDKEKEILININNNYKLKEHHDVKELFLHWAKQQAIIKYIIINIRYYGKKPDKLK
jgi:hypothetical protein